MIIKKIFFVSSIVFSCLFLPTLAIHGAGSSDDDGDFSESGGRLDGGPVLAVVMPVLTKAINNTQSIAADFSTFCDNKFYVSRG